MTRPHVAVPIEVQQAMARLWVRGASLRDICIATGYGRMLVTTRIRWMVEAGILRSSGTERLWNPKGRRSKRPRQWVKHLATVAEHVYGLGGNRRCPHGHYMSKKNTMLKWDGSTGCRKCYNIDMLGRYHLRHSGLLDGRVTCDGKGIVVVPSATTGQDIGSPPIHGAD